MKEDVSVKKMIVGVFLVLLTLVLFSLPVRAGDLNVSAAMSLREAVTELSNTFSAKNPGVKIQNNFAASGALAKQIENGAPADIYFSANVKWMDFLAEKGLVDRKNTVVVAYNAVVFVGKPDLKAKTMQDLVKLEKIAVGSPRSVPAGDYAVQAMKKAGIEKQLEGRLVMAKDVRECLMYADRGEVTGAFVYKTDAEQMAKNVKILFVVPQELYPRVTYPLGMTAAGAKKPEAVAYFRFAQSAEGKKILAKHGFVVE